MTVTISKSALLSSSTVVSSTSSNIGVVSQLPKRVDAYQPSDRRHLSTCNRDLPKCEHAAPTDRPTRFCITTPTREAISRPPGPTRTSGSSSFSSTSRRRYADATIVQPIVRQLASSVDHRTRHLPRHLQILSGRLRLARRRRGASFYVFGAIDDRFQTPTARRTRFSAPASPRQPLHAQQHPGNLECDEDPRNPVHRPA